MAGVTVSVSAELLKSRFGEIQDPLCSYIESRSEIIEKEEAVFDKIFRETKSKHYSEGYSYETELSDMLPVGENGAYPVTSLQEGYPKTIYNMTFKNSFPISREAIDDDNFTTFKRKSDKLMRSYYRGRARMKARMIGEALQGHTSFSVNGFPFSTVGADGVCVFSASHAPKVSGSNQSNVYSDAFTHAALFAGVQKMQNLKDDDGNTLDLNPNAILIPNNNPSLKQAVLEVVTSMQKPGTNNNDNNVLFGNFEVICSAYLNDYIGALTAPWILLDLNYNEENDGNIYQERVPLEIRSELGNNDENLWKAYARYGLGFVDFRQMMAFGVTGASSM